MTKDILAALRNRFRLKQQPAAVSHPDIVTAMYQGLLGRVPDPGGYSDYLRALDHGSPLADLLRSLATSGEFRSHHQSVQIIPSVLPDLTKVHPEKYSHRPNGRTVFEAKSDDDFGMLESYIGKYRYYDNFGVWVPVIDLDKRVTAAIAKGLGAKSCIELGCFSGPVLSVLDSDGVDVCGIDVSHLAFAIAYPNVRDKMLFGDLLDLKLDRTFDVLVAMDVIEHLNPLKLDAYIPRIAALVAGSGFALVNSPMIGTDDVFGTPFEPYLPEWAEAGDDALWRHMDCDAKGWPLHGHLVWASPKWWEAQFAKHGLIRERRIERHLQSRLKTFFDENAPARRSLFVLRHADFMPDVDAVCRKLSSELAAVLPK